MSEVTKKEMFLEVTWRKDDGQQDPENCRVENILKPILSHLEDEDKIGYHFGECDGHDEYHLEDLMSDLPKNAEWHTIYDSCYFPFTDGGSYSIIQVAYADNREHFYLSVSLGGCQLSSALTEYFKVPMTGKWAWSAKYPDQVDSADEDHIYFNADPGESENGVTGPAEYYDEDGL